MNYPFQTLRPRKLWSVVSVVVLVLGATVVLSSCDTLNKEPTSDYSNETVWQDAALATAFANRAYDVIPYDFQRTGRILPYSYMSDESHSRESISTIGRIVQGTFGPSYMGPMNIWTEEPHGRSQWEPINQANKLLANIEDASIEQSLKDRLAAEMKAVRAYSYFKLISTFGGVPLITEPFSLGDDFEVERSSYDQVMDFIVSELDESMGDLPREYSADNKGRVTKGAARAIKARALLYAASELNNPENDQSKWQAAADAAKAVIDMGKYSLADNYKTFFMAQGGYSTPEMIWGRPTNIDSEVEVLVERYLFPNGEAGYGHVHPLQGLVDAFEMKSGVLPENSPEYSLDNPYENRDPRFYDTILYNGAPFKGRQIETFLPGGFDSGDGPNSPWNATQTGYYVRKFIDESKCGCNSNASGSSSPTWPWFRYAEVLLNYAEASYHLGNEATAREYVNMVRSRPSVDMPDVTASGQELLEAIRHERRIELVFEGHRFFDVRRWKIATEVFDRWYKAMDIQKDPETGELTYAVENFREAHFEEKHYLAPIPSLAMDRNPALEQNPGY